MTQNEMQSCPKGSIARTSQDIVTEKRKLFMEFQNMANIPENRERREQIKVLLQDLDRDLQAFASVLGDRSREPRLMQCKNAKK